MEAAKHALIKQEPVIVIGLGIAGLFATYQLSKRGHRVIGYDQFSCSGATGSSSAGLTRIYRYSSTDLKLQEYSRYDKVKWKELENISGEKLLTMTGGIFLGPREHSQMQSLLKHSVQKADEILNPESLMKKYSALQIPDNYVAIASPDMGFLHVRKILRLLKKLCEEQGAELHYNCKLMHILTKDKLVAIKTEGGVKKLKYSKLIMTTGPYTYRFKKEKNVTPSDAETIVIKDPKGLPPIVLSFEDDRIFMLPNDPEMKEWKIGIDVKRSLFKLYQLIDKFIPSKMKSLGQIQPCFYTIREPEDGLQVYEENEVVWCYGFTGHGFKHGPSIGKIVADLVQKIKPKL